MDRASRTFDAIISVVGWWSKESVATSAFLGLEQVGRTSFLTLMPRPVRRWDPLDRGCGD